MAVTAEQIARTWRRREAERAARAAHRAQRLTALLPDARRLLIETHRASAVLLFGSLAVGDPPERSDVDLAVQGLPPGDYFAALSDLMALFGGPVDLVRIE